MQDTPAPEAVRPPCTDPAPEASSERLVWHGPKGRRIDYTATAERVPVRLFEDGSLAGSMFMLSYVTEESDMSDRPVTFLWNGGPGASSLMVNVGGLGPHCVPVDGTEPLGCPARFEDNPYTLLTESDLVFVDALGTGYSVPDSSFDAKRVWGVDGDASLFASAVAAWLARHHRWNAPVYLFGESYGTLRNAVVLRILGERGVGVAGVVELSSILDYAATLPGNDCGYLGMVPLYAMAARHFGKAGEGSSVEEWWDRAVAFVDDELAAALTKGDLVPEGRMEELARSMAELVGLPAELLARRGLRVELDDFRTHILADEGLTCGRYDMRFTTPAYQPVQGDSAFFAGEDPSMDAVASAYQGVYLKLVEETGFVGDPNYESLSLKVNETWNWTHRAPGTSFAAPVPDVSLDLACALRRNPRCRVMFVGGYYDAATPFWNLRHDMAKLFLPDGLKARVEYHIHECGHMAYADRRAAKEIYGELRSFYGGSSELALGARVRRGWGFSPATPTASASASPLPRSTRPFSTPR